MSRVVLDHTFWCTSCGKRNPYNIPRKAGKERPAGHLKRIFCLNCQKVRNMVECIPWSKYDEDDFRLEYENNNFDKRGNRKKTYSELRVELHEKGEL